VKVSEVLRMLRDDGWFLVAPEAVIASSKIR
jgi:predicted RNA binding protein YcfA (HicA-like mRNA interferase family)